MSVSENVMDFLMSRDERTLTATSVHLQFCCTLCPISNGLLAAIIGFTEYFFPHALVSCFNVPAMYNQTSY